MTNRYSIQRIAQTALIPGAVTVGIGAAWLLPALSVRHTIADGIVRSEALSNDQVRTIIASANDGNCLMLVLGGFAAYLAVIAGLGFGIHGGGALRSATIACALIALLQPVGYLLLAHQAGVNEGASLELGTGTWIFAASCLVAAGTTCFRFPETGGCVGHATPTVMRCQPEAPSGSSGAESAVCSSPEPSVARTTSV